VELLMITVRQIERLWNEKSYRRLTAELLSTRSESTCRLDAELSNSLGAAALAMIRLDELEQSHHPLNRKLLNVILVAQEADGGWGDPLRSALCLRALLCSRGEGTVVERGLGYLATMQKAEGVWPKEPIRRMPADGLVSAFVMFELAAAPRFREVVRIDDAVGWFMRNEQSLDSDALRLWELASLRYHTNTMLEPVKAGLWS
jgi:hypothetical protein